MAALGDLPAGRGGTGTSGLAERTKILSPRRPNVFAGSSKANDATRSGRRMARLTALHPPNETPGLGPPRVLADEPPDSHGMV
jgi:hypothetical protein